ncbi:MAG: tRNA (adenosine(37)-N6)-threonylcarbamoyltransferase complex dimerization subunit type 1 TsaB [Peptostreptococcaceae bacterium]|nr:tRNA (adenosine(37)-N6)-threonylcarbamoyltransferase complex dimerization subunit type 1 TsaB [Peptostreptococcaceae bacterium]
MKILAIDTSSSVLSLAVSSDGVILGELMQNKALTHSERLMPHIEYLFSSLDEKVQQMDCFAVTNGPGSFTGIRIGVATANAFAMASGKKVVGISTLEALAHNYRHSDAFIIATMYAQREDYYRGLYQFNNGEMIVHKEEDAISKEEILNEAKIFSKQGNVIIVGELASALAMDDEFADKNMNCETKKSIIQLGIAADNYVRGAILCEIASKQVDRARDFVSPVYIRKPQAEVQYEEKQRALEVKDGE